MPVLPAKPGRRVQLACLAKQVLGVSVVPRARGAQTGLRGYLANRALWVFKGPPGAMHRNPAVRRFVRSLIEFRVTHRVWATS